MGCCFSVEADAEIENLRTINAILTRNSEIIKRNHEIELATWKSAHKSWVDHSKNLSRELQALKAKPIQSSDTTRHLIIDGNNIGWRPINAKQDKLLMKEATKRMKSAGDRPPKGRMTKEEHKRLFNEWESRRNKIFSQLKWQSKTAPTNFDDDFNKMFETAIVSCIYSIKEMFPDLKITLVLYVKHQTEKIQKLHDDQLCVNFLRQK